MQTLEIFYITCYESKTMSQSSCSNPSIIFRSFVWYMKPSATISYSSVDNKSPFLKFLSDCQKPFTQICTLCRILTLHGEYSTLQLHQGHDANIERPIGVNTKPRFKDGVSFTSREFPQFRNDIGI